MTLQEAINKRISRRTYLDIPINQSKLDNVHQMIDKYNEESGLNIFLIIDGSNVFNGLTKSYGMFRGVKTIIALKGKKDDENLDEKAGYYGELIVLEATGLGLGTCWVGASFDKSSQIFDVKDHEKLVCVITVGNTPENNTFKENMIRKMSHRKVKPAENFYISDTTPPQWFLEGIQAVQKAPSAINRQKYKFTYKNDIVTAFSENSYRYDMIDLGIAKAHFVIAAGGNFEWGNNGKHIQSEK